MKRALITGVLGQDGRYLAEYLHLLNYEIHGITKSLNSTALLDLQSKVPNIVIHQLDISDTAKVGELLRLIEPDEIYNLAGFSSVHKSWKFPDQAKLINEVAFSGILNCVKEGSHKENLRNVRIYQASSSELFGLSKISPQNEETPYSPSSPYGFAKLAAHEAAIEARLEHGLFVSTGILYNHESPYRSPEFVTRKISIAVARISQGEDVLLKLGDIEGRRDWGFAGDYVIAMWKMLQQKVPETYVISTGVSTSVRDLIDVAFNHIGVEDWGRYVVFDSLENRPVDPVNLVGDSAKAKFELGWMPETPIEHVMRVMVDSDIKLLNVEKV